MEDYNKNAKRFFIYSYLNIDINDIEDKDDGIMKCARRAYRDLHRTLRFNKIGLNNKENDYKQSFVTDICDSIKTEINELFDELNRNKKIDDFDKEHKKICNSILEKAEEEKDVLKEKMHYGQAQKWLNMTLKYMWLTGIWESEFNTGNLLPELHVPVDRYIIEAVWKNKNITLPLKGVNRNKDYKHPADKVEAWSKWEGSDYDKFQESLKQELKKEGMIPILWENSKWIEIAKKRN
ncbi:hypothetical protein [uncultured Eubacterium sp.]|uniref:hypothetical protein n=1 Tax=Eubacterium sp. TaxID=142586 RepID=UPI002670F035|nr:hypothetical protein [uncultured Eubacterium sp.]